MFQETFQVENSVKLVEEVCLHSGVIGRRHEVVSPMRLQALTSAANWWERKLH